MIPVPNLPTLLIDEGARRLALVHLDASIAARSRLTHSSDADALHDYRVALRRLRSCLRAYNRAFQSTVTTKVLRRLRRLAHATNRSRDLEVHLAWLAEQSTHSGDIDRPGIMWMIERLTAEQEHAREDMLDLDATLFPKIHTRLVSQLMRFQATINLESDSRRRSTAAVTARRVRATVGRLKNRLERIHGYSNVAAIHRTRISAKHLRYLLEPFATAVPNGEAAVEQLKTLQNGFGMVHDAQMFAAELGHILSDTGRAATIGTSLMPGLETLMASSRARAWEAFNNTARSWLGGAAEPFFHNISAVAEAIAGLVDRDREIERKFLLTGFPSGKAVEKVVEIEQGYLPGERLIERIRRAQSENGLELTRTIKGGSGLTRIEIEETVSSDLFAQLWPLTEGRRLRKRRHRIPDGDLTWEIDEFLDRDLVLAEVELTGRPVDVDIPEWLQSHVNKEVTEDDAYSNFRLALEGGPARASNPPQSPGGP